MAPAATAFFAAADGDLSDVKALHSFRIAGKRLRYAMELFAAAFPPAFREELYPLVEELQEKLGEINDHAAAAARLEEWQAELAPPAAARRSASAAQTPRPQPLPPGLLRLVDQTTRRRLEEAIRPGCCAGNRPALDRMVNRLIAHVGAMPPRSPRLQSDRRTAHVQSVNVGPCSLVKLRCR